MARGSQILIGIVLILLASVCVILALMPKVPGEHSPIAVQLMAAMLTGTIRFACIFTWGRPYTIRAAFGLLSLAMIGAAVAVLLSDQPNHKAALFAGLVAVTSGTYAVSGLYPGWLPMSDVFGEQDPEKPSETQIQRPPPL